MFSESLFSTPTASMCSATVGMRPSLEHTAASSALVRNTLVFLPRRLGKLRVGVDTTVAPSRTWAWLAMHREQPDISLRAPAEPKVAQWPSLASAVLRSNAIFRRCYFHRPGIL